MGNYRHTETMSSPDRAPDRLPQRSDARRWLGQLVRAGRHRGVVTGTVDDGRLRLLLSHPRSLRGLPQLIAPRHVEICDVGYSKREQAAIALLVGLVVQLCDASKGARESGNEAAAQAHCAERERVTEVLCVLLGALSPEEVRCG